MNPFLPTPVEQLTGLLWIASLQAVCLVPLAAVVNWVFRGTAWQRARLWKLTLYGLLLVPLATLLLPHCYVFYAGRWEPVPFPALRLPGTVILPARLAAQAGIRPSWFYRGVLALWASVALFRALQLAYGWRKTIELVRSGRPMRTEAVRQFVQSPHCSLPLRDVTVVVTPSVQLAACWRFQRPTVLLSPDVVRLPRAELQMILAHEVAHLCQNHSVALFASSLCRILFWFHPAVWWAVAEFERWGELACDEFVVSESGDAHGYAALLARLALGDHAASRAPQPVVPFLDRRIRPMERIHWILRTQAANADPTSCQPRVAAAIVLLALCQAVLAVGRVDVYNLSVHEGHTVWTAWPPFTARLADLCGITLRDYPLDAFRHDVLEGTELRYRWQPAR